MTSVPNKSNRTEAKPTYSFMTCVLKVKRHGSGWESIIMKVLGNMHGVSNFRMGENGKVLVSGKVTPVMLLKVFGKAGKKAEIIWWQFGECPSNLFLPLNNPNLTMYGQYDHETTGGYDKGYYSGYDGDYYNGYGGNNYYQGGYGGSSLLNDCPCPIVECGKKKITINEKSKQQTSSTCCTLM